MELKKLFKSKTAKIIALCLLSIVLLFAIYRVFFTQEENYKPTERESRLCRLLGEVEGVGAAEAYVEEEGGIPVSAIVVFEGADSILTRMRVMEISAKVLNLSKSCVQVYPKKGKH